MKLQAGRLPLSAGIFFGKLFAFFLINIDMKHILLLGLAISLHLGLSAQQKLQKIPAVDLKTLDGKTFNTANIVNDGKPIIISFWATWCAPCKKELNAIAENFESWQKETGVKIYAISIDDSRNSSKVAPYVNGQGWDYTVLLDENSDFKRALNVNNVPHTFVLNANREIVWQNNNYTEGGESKLLDVLKKIAKGEKVE
jgi:cytochrome c biogenesis protein CcmG/thiol:disulfide interchange protein DsbE